MRGAAPRPGLFASTDFNNNDKRVYFYGRNNLTLWRQRLGYGIADLSCNLVWQMISLYLMFFYTDVMGLPAYYVGLMFLVTRLVDGVADVLMGLVIDNTATAGDAVVRICLLARSPSDCCVFWPSTCQISAPPVS